MEKYLVVAHFGDKSYSDGGIALVRASSMVPGKKDILAIGPWCDGGYIVEEWPSDWYEHFGGGKQLSLPDTIWDAVTRYRDAKYGDSKRKVEEARVAFERLIGPDLVIEMHLAGAF